MSDEPAPDATRPARRSYIGDEPVATEVQDELGRYPFAKALAESIASHPGDDCLVIGLYAPWGAGKTSTLHFMERELTASQRVVLVKFNPWRYSGEDNLLEEFYNVLGTELDVTLRRWYEKSAAKTAACVVEKGTAIVGAGLGAGGAVAEPIGKALTSLANRITDVQLDELKTRVKVALTDQELRVVVLVDDLDRLEAHEVHAMLRLVRLNADFPRTTYVLSADPGMVATALAARIGYKDEGYGQSFLEKIVQVPVYLPPCDPTAIRLMVDRGLDEVLADANVRLDPSSQQRLSDGFLKYLWPAFTTPRQVKRFINAIRLQIAVTAGEVNTADLILLEGIRLLHPEIYARLGGSRKLLLGAEEDSIFPEPGDSREAHQGLLNQLLEPLPEDASQRMRGLLALLFPHVRSLIENYSAPDFPPPEWVSARRACTHEYFDRHFAGGIPKNDIRDTAIVQFLDLLSGGAEEAAGGWLKALGPHVDHHRLLAKLGRVLRELPASRVAKAVVSLARLGEKFDASQSGIFFSPRSVSVGLVVELLHRLPAGAERVEVAKTIIGAPTDLGVAVDVFDSSAVYEEKNRSRAAFTLDEQTQLLMLLTSRLETAAHQALAAAGQHLARVLWAWRKVGPVGAPTAWLEQAVAQDPAILDLVLLGFAGESFEVESKRERPNLTADGYEQLTGVIGVELVGSLIRERFGGKLPATDDGAGLSGAEGVASQFLYYLQRGQPTLPPSDSSGVQDLVVGEPNTSDGPG